MDPDDLYQLGCVGFLKAVAGFDLSYGTQFSTYAVPKIAGEIRRFLRDDGHGEGQPEPEGARRADPSRRAQRLTGTLGREPAVSELAAELGLTPEEIAMAETATGTAESIQRETGEEGFSLEDVLTARTGWRSRCWSRISLREGHRAADRARADGH